MHMSSALLGVLACRRSPARHTLPLNSLCSWSAAALIRAAVQTRCSFIVDHAEYSTTCTAGSGWDAVDSTRQFGSHHHGRSWQSLYNSSFGTHGASWASKVLWGQQHLNYCNFYQTSNSSSSSISSSSGDDHSNRSSRINRSSSSSNSRTIRGAAGGSWSETWKPTSKALHPPLLTARIKATTTHQQLQQVVQQHGAAMDHIHIAAAVTQLGRWKTGSGSNDNHDQPAVFQLLGQLEQLLLRPHILQQCGCRELANMLWAICALRYTHTAMYSSCMGEFMRKLSAVEYPQHISNVLYGVAKCGQTLDEAQVQQLLTALVRPDLLHHAEPQAISNTLWGVSTMGQQLPSKQLQLLLAALVSKLPAAMPQGVSNTLWAVATMEQQVPEQQLQPLLAALVSKLPAAKPQDVSNTLWAVATMEQQVPEQQLQQLLTALVCKLSAANPQAISNTLWAVATMGQQVPKHQLQQMLAAFASKLSAAKPQEVSNTLWAVATIKHQMPEQQLQLLLAAFTSKLSAAAPQAVSNTLWACAAFSYLPGDLLATVATQPYLDTLVAGMNPQELANTALAGAQLAHRDDKLMGALLQRAGQLLGQQGNRSSRSSSKFNSQNVCNLVWAVAVLGLKQHAVQLAVLVQAACPQWASMVPQNLQQLYQTHQWLLDCQLAGGQGLAGTLTGQQLEQCRAAWAAQLAAAAVAPPSQLQRDVFAALNQLPLSWQQQPAIEQLSQPDGALLIDITLVSPDGVLLAIEVDGPTHFRRPDRQLTGPTQHRNRALAARGYTVVSVPYYEWDALRGSEQQQQYLRDLIDRHLKACQQQQQQQRKRASTGEQQRHC